MKRTFIAIKLEAGEKLKKLICHFRDTLKNEKIKWVEEENLHLTLRFLGNTDPSQLMKVKQLLLEICGQHTEFGFDLTGTGIFKSLRKPRVIWVGITHGSNLQAVYYQINNRIEKAGFSKENDSWSPHLTIGRIREIKYRNLLGDLLEQYRDIDIQHVNVYEIIYYESKILPSGPVYIPVEKFFLNKAGENAK
jgi:2'-5' RNA ligase